MRSRYSAYARGRSDYVFRTWHPRTRPADLSLDDDISWLGLEIGAVDAGGADDDLGEVEFTAHYRDAEGPAAMHERSRFERRAGSWCYVDGDVD